MKYWRKIVQMNVKLVRLECKTRECYAVPSEKTLDFKTNEFQQSYICIKQ